MPESANYQLISAKGRKLNQPALIDDLDTSTIKLNQLLESYYDVYFIVKSKYKNHNQVLYFDDLPLAVQVSDQTIQEYLMGLGDNTLESLGDELPLHVRGEVYSWDVHSWNFIYESYSEGMHPKANIPEEDKEDLLLYHNVDKDHTEELTHSLVSVNGLFHYHEPFMGGWMIKHGNITRNKHPNSTHLNILDFTQVGSLELIRITDKMIRPSVEGASLKDAVYIDTTKYLKGKTVGIVIGGYFHLLDHTYKKVSERMIKINFNNIKWESLYYKIKELTDLGFSITDYGDDRTLGFELYHDTVITQLLTSPLSFLVVIDNPAIIVQEEPIGHQGIPGRYETGLPPIYPLRIAEGRYPAYKAIKEHDRWSIAVEDNITPLQVRYQKKEDKFNMIHNRIYPLHGQEYARAHFVRIISDMDLKVREIDHLLDDSVKDLGSLKPYMTQMDLGQMEFVRDNVREYYLPKLIVDVDLKSEYYQLPVSRY